MAARYDLILRNATVIDGTRKPRYQADVGVSGDRIARIGSLEKSLGQTEAEVRDAATWRGRPRA